VTLRAKLLGTYIGLTLAGIVLVSAVASWQINNYLDRRAETGLRGTLEGFAAVCGDSVLGVRGLSAVDRTLREMARFQGVRLTLIRHDGVVVFDSQVPADSVARMENHLHRPEIQNSRAVRVGVDRRRSATVDEEFLYAATPVVTGPSAHPDTLFVRTALRLDDIRLIDHQVQAIVWVIGFIILGCIAIVSVNISRRITDPILAIARTARDIREGDLSRRIPVSSHDEIGALAASINDMAEKLGNDIVQLRKLERVRSEFLGNVSHELRTPIFSLQGFLETLLDGAIDDPSVNREFLEKAHKHAGRLNALLNDLIEISRIESGEMKMSFRYMPIGEFLLETIAEHKSAAEKKGISLTVDVSATPGDKVYADRARLAQVMINLLDNAVKYTDTGGSVTCRTRKEGDRCVIDVTDTGSGIAPEHHARVFERFYRVDRDRSRDVGGTGLGLAIVKHIVEAHGGKIGLESVPGQGSTFHFSLRTT
jgi:two-component system, OmpR family, phosphate regulon sensor histidine kinase PhoR